MEEDTMVKKGIIGILSLFFLGTGLWAGGWNNTLMGSRAIAIGGSFVGIADDPSAVFYNPAGLVFQEKRLNVSINGFYIWPTHSYTTPAGTKLESRYNNPLPQAFITYKTSDKITIGFGMYVPFAGGGVDWQKSDQLEYPLKSVLGIVTLSPVLSYQVSDAFSFGLKANYYRAVLTVNTEMPGIGPMDTEESGSTISGGIGLMFKPSERLRIGVDLRGPAKMHISGITSLHMSGIKFNLDSETRFNLPWDFEVGLSYKISNSLLFATSVQYTLWSTLEKVEKTIEGVPFTGDIKRDELMDFRDILIWRAGFEYLLPVGIFLRAGFGLDRYAAPEDTLNITNIDVNKYTFLGGIGYKSGNMQMDFSYVYAIGTEREKHTSAFGFPLIEKYDLDVFILGFGVTFSF
jgi:long-chain fatty acid transport protein